MNNHKRFKKHSIIIIENIIRLLYMNNEEES